MKLTILKTLRELKGKLKAWTSETHNPEMILCFNGRAFEYITRLMHMSELRDPKKLISRALTIYKVLLEHISHGGKIILRDKHGREKVLDPLSDP